MNYGQENGQETKTEMGTANEKEEAVDRRGGEKTISKSGQERALPAQLGQLKTGQDEQGLLRSHL